MIEHTLKIIGFCLLIFVLGIIAIRIAKVEVNDYKCFAELYPEEAKELRLVKLGEIQEGELRKYRGMTECKHLKTLLWIRFVDVVDINGEFDNNCDFALYIEIQDRKPLMAATSCMDALKDIAGYCLNEGLDVKEFMHSVPKVHIKFKGIEA